MNIEDIQVGTDITIHISKDKDGNISETFSSQIATHFKDNKALILTPISKGVLFKMKSGWFITISFLINNDLYRLKCKIIKNRKENGLNLLEVKSVSQLLKIQRRDYFRLKVELPIMFNIKGHEQIINETTVDISGGGLNFNYIKPLENFELIECKLKLPKQDISFLSKVVRCNEFKKGNSVIYNIGVKFEEIREADRDKIVKFIHFEQLKIRKKSRNTKGSH